MIVILVFIPLFALTGMEGRLFTPLGISLHRFDPRVAGGVTDGHSRSVLLAARFTPRLT